MGSREHWDGVYAAKQPHEVSWYRPHLDVSLALIRRAAPERTARIIDVGGGESTLVDDLLRDGYEDVTLLDVSSTALDVARARLGPCAGRVHWICADVTRHPFAPSRYDVWHDRAVFHFLTDPAARRAYVDRCATALAPGGFAIVATFGPEGPTQCSGLPVVRYDPAGLHAAFGNAFRLLEHRSELHETPAGRVQQFIYCWCRYGVPG